MKRRWCLGLPAVLLGAGTVDLRVLIGGAAIIAAALSAALQNSSRH